MQWCEYMICIMMRELGPDMRNMRRILMQCVLNCLQCVRPGPLVYCDGGRLCGCCLSRTKTLTGGKFGCYAGILKKYGEATPEK